jgi:hypothetical protein
MMVGVLVLGPAVLVLGTALAQTVAVTVARRVRKARPAAPTTSPFGPETRS